MKKLILFLILILPAPGYSFGPAIQAVLSASTAAGTYFCSTCPDATAGADVLCEDCHAGGATGVCEWTKVEAGGDTGTISFAATPDNNPALGCTDIGMDYAVNVVKANTTGGSTYAHYTVSDTTLYAQFYIKINSEGLANDEYIELFDLSNSSWQTSFWFRLMQAAGVLYFNTLYYHTTWQSDTYATTSVSLDTWYGVRVEFKNPAGDGSDSIKVWIDFANNGTWTQILNHTALTFNRSVDRVVIGHLDSVTKTINYYLSGLKVDNDTMPTACAR